MKPARHYPILWDAQLRHRMIKRLKSPEFAVQPKVTATLSNVLMLALALLVYCLVASSVVNPDSAADAHNLGGSHARR